MPSTKILGSTVLIVVGTITTVIFSPRHTDVNTTEELFAVFVSTAFIVYVIPCVLILSVSFGITKYMTHIKEHRKNEYSSLYYKLHRFSIATYVKFGHLYVGKINIFFEF